MPDVAVNIALRAEQDLMHEGRKRFAVRVVHRRGGKSYLCACEALFEALTTKRSDWRGFIVGPTYSQIKKIIFDYLKAFTKDLPGVTINESELRFDFPNGSRIQLLSGENYDSMRGLYIDFCAVDEAQMLPSVMLHQVIRPALADRAGSLIVQGTPQGMQNLLYECVEYARTAGDSDWSLHMLPVTSTNIIQQAELTAMKRMMSEADWNQEMLLSFQAAIKGAYFANEMQAMAEADRITDVKYDAAAPVQVALDLGYSDLMVAGFWQPVGTEHRLIMTRAYQQTKIADMCGSWKDLPFRVDTVILPHDAEQHELTSGMTRTEIFRSFYEDVVVTARVKSKHEGIEQTRALLPHVWMDRSENDMTIQAMHNYRADYDEKKRVARLTPRHDWSSHYADMMQTYALGRPPTVGGWDMTFDPRKASNNLRRSLGL